MPARHEDGDPFYAREGFLEKFEPLGVELDPHIAEARHVAAGTREALGETERSGVSDPDEDDGNISDWRPSRNGCGRGVRPLARR